METQRAVVVRFAVVVRLIDKIMACTALRETAGDTASCI